MEIGLSDNAFYWNEITKFSVPSCINQAEPLTYDHVIIEDAPIIYAHPCHRMCGGITITRQDLNSSSILYEVVQNINCLSCREQTLEVQHLYADDWCCAAGETPLLKLNSLPPDLKMPFYLFWVHRTGEVRTEEASDCLLCLENACQNKRKSLRSRSPMFCCYLVVVFSTEFVHIYNSLSESPHFHSD